MAQGRLPKLLLIDDDPSVREVVSCLLASFGYDCQTAADGLEGLARFDEGGRDIVVTDLSMPEMSGWGVAGTIRRRSSTMPIVLITGLVDAEVLQRAGERGLPVVSKPFRAEMLRTVVRNALQASRSLETSSSRQDCAVQVAVPSRWRTRRTTIHALTRHRGAPTPGWPCPGNVASVTSLPRPAVTACRTRSSSLILARRGATHRSRAIRARFLASGLRL
jgi:CheY-like chemotaxis protein